MRRVVSTPVRPTRRDIHIAQSRVAQLSRLLLCRSTTVAARGLRHIVPVCFLRFCPWWWLVARCRITTDSLAASATPAAAAATPAPTVRGVMRICPVVRRALRRCDSLLNGLFVVPVP